MRPVEYAYTADFWIWFDYKQTALDPLQNVEIINTKEAAYTDQYHAKADSGTLLASESGRITLLHNWAVEDYPFDKQTFRIELEAGLDTSKMVLQPSAKGFTLYKDLTIPGWDVKSSYTKQSLITYESDFGERDLHGHSTFSRITYLVDVKRQGWGLFFKLMLGVYVAFFVAYIVFFLPPANEQRFGLSIGALFAAVANKYVIDSAIPPSISFGFVDQVHVCTLVFILSTLVLSIISLKLDKAKSKQTVIRFNRLCAIIVVVAYTCINVLLISIAYLN